MLPSAVSHRMPMVDEALTLSLTADSNDLQMWMSRLCHAAESGTPCPSQRCRMQSSCSSDSGAVVCAPEFSLLLCREWHQPWPTNSQEYCYESKVTFLSEKSETTANSLLKPRGDLLLLNWLHLGAFCLFGFSPLATSLLKKARGQEPFLFSYVVLTWSFLQWKSLVPRPCWA